MEHFAHGARRPWSTSPTEHVTHGARCALRRTLPELAQERCVRDIALSPAVAHASLEAYCFEGTSLSGHAVLRSERRA